MVVSTSPTTLTRAVPDDYEYLEPGDRVLLVVEDDLTFAMTTLEMARASEFKGVVARSGHQALELLSDGLALLGIALPLLPSLKSP